jgi:hypothetical protein
MVSEQRKPRELPARLLVCENESALSRRCVNVKVAEAILASYAKVPDFDPREQRWTVAKASQ